MLGGRVPARPLAVPIARLTASALPSPAMRNDLLRAALMAGSVSVMRGTYGSQARLVQSDDRPVAHVQGRLGGEQGCRVERRVRCPAG